MTEAKTPNAIALEIVTDCFSRGAGSPHETRGLLVEALDAALTRVREEALVALEAIDREMLVGGTYLNPKLREQMRRAIVNLCAVPAASIRSLATPGQGESDA